MLSAIAERPRYGHGGGRRSRERRDIRGYPSGINANSVKPSVPEPTHHWINTGTSSLLYLRLPFKRTRADHHPRIHCDQELNPRFTGTESRLEHYENTARDLPVEMLARRHGPRLSLSTSWMSAQECRRASSAVQPKPLAMRCLQQVICTCAQLWTPRRSHSRSVMYPDRSLGCTSPPFQGSSSYHDPGIHSQRAPRSGSRSLPVTMEHQ